MSEKIRTAVFLALGRLLKEWRDDPERLAVACAAWEEGGWSAQWLVCEAFPERAHDDAEAWEIIDRARYRKNKRLLGHRAQGLLFALEALAVDANRALLHDMQIESAVIECRRLPIDERVKKLRGVAA